MTKDELVAYLSKLQESHDTERAHGDADDALLAYIGDEDIAAAFKAILKWYA